MMHDKDENAKVWEMVRKKLQQQQKQERQVEDEDCPRETYAQLYGRSQALVPSSNSTPYTQNSQK